ncbi:MAG TPA: ABC transporter permease [Acidimicrobiales bacterium]|nr:ABC transporter permease [Acidimicrobiales bacterium]
MLVFIGKRFGAALAIVVLLVGVMFALQKMSGIDPAHAYLGAGASAQAVATEKRALGLDASVPVQFGHYLSGVFQGNFGTSYRTRDAVSHDLVTYLPATVELAGYALALAVVMGLVLGIASAASWRGSKLLKALMMSGASAPIFLLCLLGILLFYGHLGWLPATGRTSYATVPTGPTGLLTVDALLHGRFGILLDAWRHLVLPAFCLSIVPAVSIGRVLRGSLVSVLSEDYVRTARSKGMRERAVLLRHALRNAVGPALSMTGLQAGLLLAGDVVVEQIFAWPGVGNYIAQGLPVGDFPAISGVTIVFGVGYVAVNAAVDLLQRLADPRVRI